MIWAKRKDEDIFGFKKSSQVLANGKSSEDIFASRKSPSHSGTDGPHSERLVGFRMDWIDFVLFQNFHGDLWKLSFVTVLALLINAKWQVRYYLEPRKLAV